MRLFLPVTCDAVAVDAAGVLHAVDPFSLQRRDRRYKRTVLRQQPPRRWVVRCGARVVDLVTARSSDDELIGMTWPPRARVEGGRCRECWVATGKPRPSRAWEQVA